MWTYTDNELAGCLPAIKAFLEMTSPQQVEYYIHRGYGAAMALTLALGIIGNILAVCVLFRPEHRKRPMTFLMLNMCFADLLVCVFGYSVAVHHNMMEYGTFNLDHWRCTWLAFVNCATGLSVIGTLTAMSFVSYKGVTTLERSCDERFPYHKMIIFLSVIWTYAVFLTVPPLFGWNEYVPVQSKVSCHPNWESSDPSDVAYILVLAVGGFFVPLTAMVLSYGNMYRYIRRNGMELSTSNDQQKKARLSSQKKTVRVIVAAVAAFFFSWAPYCFVSLGSTVKGSAILDPMVSLVPEMMAKASVIYNPIIYFFLNSRFRSSLKKLFCGNKISPGGTTNQSGTGCSQDNRRKPCMPVSYNAGENSVAISQDQLTRRTVAVLSVD